MSEILVTWKFDEFLVKFLSSLAVAKFVKAGQAQRNVLNKELVRQNTCWPSFMCASTGNRTTRAKLVKPASTGK